MKRIKAAVAGLFTIGIMAAVINVSGPAYAASPTCHTAYYPDGKAVFRACLVWTNPAGAGWNAYEVYNWNPTVANNGHTDNLSPMVTHDYLSGGAQTWTIDQLTDGETQSTLDQQQAQTDSNTVWTETRSTYDGKCYRIFLAPNVGSWDRQNNCSTF